MSTHACAACGGSEDVIALLVQGEDDTTRLCGPCRWELYRFGFSLSPPPERCQSCGSIHDLKGTESCGHRWPIVGMPVDLYRYEVRCAGCWEKEWRHP